MKLQLIGTFIVSLALKLVLCGDDTNNLQKDKYFLHKNCESAIQRQIDEEIHASLVYSTMAAHFSHNKVARPNVAKFFLDNSKEEWEHGHKFIDYLNRRGSRFYGFDIKMPAKYQWASILDALNDALKLENHVNNKLHQLHDTASEQCLDQHLMDFLENEYLDEQVKSIDLISRYITILSSMDTAMGEFLFDQQLGGSKTQL